MKTKNIEVNNECLSYIDSEKGNTTLFFIHGAFISKEYWKEQLSHFSSKYRVITIDLAGHGNSSYNRSDWTIENYSKDIRSVIEKLNLKNVILIGHSFGANIMLETVTNDSSEIIGLVEVDHLKNVGDELPKETINYLVENLKTNFSITCKQYAHQALLTDNTDSSLSDKLLSDFSQFNPEVGVPLLQNNFNYVNREIELLKKLNRKIFLIHVNYSPTNEVNLKKYLGNNYKLFSIEGTCHYPMLENPKNFNIQLQEIILEID